MIDFVQEEISNTKRVFELFAANRTLVECVANAGILCAGVLARRCKIMLAGNGGSAADAQHIAAEFVSRLVTDRQPLPAIALTTDSSILTATANDYGFEFIFSRQIEAIGRKGDVFIGISTSGNSENVLRAFRMARALEIATIGLTGKNGGKLIGQCDLLFRAPAERTQNIQELHIMVGHTICAIAERQFLAKVAPERVDIAPVR